MPTKIETERKYIIEMPSVEQLETLPGFTRSEITQIYLNSVPGVTHRVRKRCYGEYTELTENKKIRISKMSSNEEESLITHERFDELARNIEHGSHPLRKTRYTFSYLGLVVEIDMYSEWTAHAILEIELPDESYDISMPDFIKITREVTGIKDYSNHSMAKQMPQEP